MKVRAIMSESVFTAAPDPPLKLVATSMLDYGSRGCPSSRAGGTSRRTSCSRNESPRIAKASPVGSFTTARMHLSPSYDARTAGDAMTSPAVTIAPERSVADGALVGIVTRADLVRSFTRRRDRARHQADGCAAPALDRSGQVQVTVEDGNVVLSGTVDTPELADALIAFAERTPGVVSVESRLS